jgi:hypothetical protein
VRILSCDGQDFLESHVGFSAAEGALTTEPNINAKALMKLPNNLLFGSGRIVRRSRGLICCAAVLTSQSLRAETLTFESYQLGDINTGGQPNTALAFLETNQDGWSHAAGSRAIIAPGTANGTDGQFLTLPAPATAGNNITMIAARAATPEVAVANTVSFDLRFAAGGAAGATSIGNGVAFLNQLSGAEGTFSQTADTGMYFGQLGNGAFGVRRSNFGTAQILFSTAGGAGITTIPANALVAGNWYRVDVSITELFEINPGEQGRTVSMSVYDHANQVSLGTSTWNASDSIAFGGFAPTDTVGVVARVQRNNADDNLAGGIDNIRVAAVPDPSSGLDSDSDGLSDWYEENITLTDPQLADTDGDTISDGNEWNGFYAGVRTNPLMRDSDSDGYNDNVETNTFFWLGIHSTGTHPNKPDSDGDGIPDGRENPDAPTGLVNGIFNSDPNLIDTDSDSFTDNEELLGNGNPEDFDSTPVLTPPTTIEAENALYDPEDWSLIDATNQPYGTDPLVIPSIDNVVITPSLSAGAALVHNNDQLGDGGAAPTNGAAQGAVTFQFSGLAPGVPHYLFARVAIPTNSAIVIGDDDNGEPVVENTQSSGSNDSFFAEWTPGDFAGTAGVNQLWERGPLDTPKWFLVSSDAAARTSVGTGIFVPIPNAMPDLFMPDAQGNATVHIRGREVGLLLDTVALSPLASLRSKVDGGIGTITVSDRDADGLSDFDEVILHGTDPNDGDSDGDGYSDSEEIAAGSDPNDANNNPGEATEIRVTETTLANGVFTIRFASTAGAAGWKVKGSVDLVAFDIDETANSTVTETAPGEYRVDVDVSGAPDKYFLRVER